MINRSRPGQASSNRRPIRSDRKCRNAQPLRYVLQNAAGAVGLSTPGFETAAEGAEVWKTNDAPSPCRVTQHGEQDYKATTPLLSVSCSFELPSRPKRSG